MLGLQNNLRHLAKQSRLLRLRQGPIHIDRNPVFIRDTLEGQSPPIIDVQLPLRNEEVSLGLCPLDLPTPHIQPARRIRLRLRSTSCRLSHRSSHRYFCSTVCEAISAEILATISENECTAMVKFIRSSGVVLLYLKCTPPEAV